MLRMNHLFVYLIVLSSIILSTALKCDDKYSNTDDYFELKGIENFYKFTAYIWENHGIIINIKNI